MKIIGSFVIIFALQLAAIASPITVYLAGDSTMAEKTAEKRPETGWGEYLQIYFDEKRVKIDNRARNGRSTKSFIDEGHWQKIVDDLKPGDYVLIQFGHNDSKKEDPKRYAEAKTDYIKNLKRFASDVRKKGANPVILSPVVRRRFNEKLEFYDTHGEYPSAARGAANEADVPFIDMHGKSEALLRSFGAERSKKLFLILAEGEHRNYPKGSDDNTHFSAFGAEQTVRQAVEGLKESKLGLAKLLVKDDVDNFGARLLPTKYENGFRMDDYWVWCGSTIKGDDGKYHIYASRWSNSVGFGPYWLTNSEIVHGVSDKPEGPYSFSDIALPARGAQFWDGQMTHNPAIRKYGDTYLLYYTGTTYRGERPSATNPVGDQDPLKLEAHRQEKIGLATSKSPHGPWNRLDKPILDTRPNTWEQYLVSNAAPVVMKDGKVRLYYKGVEKLRVHAIGLAVADCPTCEYKRFAENPLNMGVGAEDPFIWQEKGKYKALMLDHERRYSPDKEIFYAESIDGIHWKVGRNAIGVSKQVTFADNTTRKMNSTERPHVLMENGKPTHVFFATGETINGKNYTWNMAIPLKK